MFKKATFLGLTATLSMMVIPVAQADVNVALQNICGIVKSDDKGAIRKKLKTVKSDYGLRLRDFYTGVTCAGNSMIRYAVMNNADEVGSYLVSRMPKRDLGKAEQDGSTLLDWANANSHDGSAVIVAAKDRIGV